MGNFEVKHNGNTQRVTAVNVESALEKLNIPYGKIYQAGGRVCNGKYYTNNVSTKIEWLDKFIK